MRATTDSGQAITLRRPEIVFSRVLVGVDGSAESYEAGRQAGLFLEDEGELTLLVAYDIASAPVGGTGVGVPAYPDEDLQRERATNPLREAREATPKDVTEKLVRGCSWEELIREAEREQDTLIAVGSHGIGRARGIVVGSTATKAAHKAPCSVLVARKAGPHFPRRIVAGVDGSLGSAAAYAAARHLAAFSAELWPVVAHGGKGVDARRVAAIVDDRHEDVPDEPVPALVAAADADSVSSAAGACTASSRWARSRSGSLTRRARRY
jgi:nucleotide-binding universal stress UspA family protein